MGLFFFILLLLIIRLLFFFLAFRIHFLLIFGITVVKKSIHKLILVITITILLWRRLHFFHLLFYFLNFRFDRFFNRFRLNLLLLIFAFPVLSHLIFFLFLFIFFLRRLLPNIFIHYIFLFLDRLLVCLLKNFLFQHHFPLNIFNHLFMLFRFLMISQLILTFKSFLTNLAVKLSIIFLHKLLVSLICFLTIRLLILLLIILFNFSKSLLL